MAIATAPSTATELDPMREVSDIVGLAMQSMVAEAIRSAEVCGCKGCKAQALEAVAWAEGMLGVETDPDV